MKNHLEPTTDRSFHFDRSAKCPQRPLWQGELLPDPPLEQTLRLIPRMVPLGATSDSRATPGGCCSGKQLINYFEDVWGRGWQLVPHGDINMHLKVSDLFFLSSSPDRSVSLGLTDHIYYMSICQCSFLELVDVRLSQDCIYGYICT